MEGLPMNNIEKDYLKAYEENMPRIFRHIASRVNDRKVTEDLTSETFFRAWDYIRKGNAILNMKAFCLKSRTIWLSTITTRNGRFCR